MVVASSCFGGFDSRGPSDFRGSSKGGYLQIETTGLVGCFGGMFSSPRKPYQFTSEKVYHQNRKPCLSGASCLMFAVNNIYEVRPI